MNKMIKIKKVLEDLGISIERIKKPKQPPVKKDYDMNLIEYKRFPVVDAKIIVHISKKDLYEVTTINWKFTNTKKNASDYDPTKPSPNYDEVHKNTYHMTLSEIFKFKKGLSQVAEDIISIKPLNERKD